jgi:hypothetical protein
MIPLAQRKATFSAGTGFEEPNDLAAQPGSQVQPRASGATDGDPNGADPDNDH